MKREKSSKGLVFLMALTIAAAVFFGSRSYSVDHKLDIPVIDQAMGNTSAGTTTAKAKSSSSGSSKSGLGGAMGGGNSNRQRGNMPPRGD